MTTFAEYTKMSREQLMKALEESRKGLFDTRYKVQNKQSKASHEIEGFKTSIARILTALKSGITGAKDLETEEKTVQNAPAPKAKAASKAAPKAKTTKKSTK